MMKKQHTAYGVSGRDRFFATLSGKLVLFFGVIIGVIAVAALVMLVIVPALSVTEPVEVEIQGLKENTFRDSMTANAKPDEKSYNLSENVHEAELSVLTAIDPYIYKKEIVFVSSSYSGGRIKYNRLFLYDCEAGNDTEIKVSLKYDNIISPRLNSDFIVFIDSASSGGGRICVYDRSTGTQTALKDFLYSVPSISLSGNILTFMQQAGDDLDRLYFVDLATLETTAYRIFSGLPEPPTAVYAANGCAVYAIPYGNDDGYDRSVLYTLDLYSGEETEAQPGKLIYSVKTDGTNTVFLTSGGGMPTDLYYMDGATPKLIEKNVVNFDMGSGFVAYTCNDAVYAYRFRNKTSYKLNSDISRASLACANGLYVCFNDVTGGFDDTVNTVKYTEVIFPNA